QDVPADHWAYDAVAQLAADGVIEGYGDGTYRGDQEITRYEMAQMVARAMAKGGNGADKALIDKLAAEFADELNSLGVRVSALEKKVDNMKWSGEIRYQLSKRMRDNNADDSRNFAQIRLRPTMQINEHWTGKAGIYYGANNAASRKNLSNGTNINDTSVKWANVEGNYGNTKIELGRFVFGTYVVDGGMIYDDYLSGARVTFGKDLKVAIGAGRTDGPWNTNGVTHSYQGLEITYVKDRLTAGLGVHHFQNKEFWQAAYGANDALIWVGGLGYKFGDFRIFGAYGQNTKGKNELIPGGKSARRAATLELYYKGANRNKPGTWGLETGYRYLGMYAALAPTYDYSWCDMKGWFFGGNVTLAKNTVLYLGYSKGKELSTGGNESILYSRVRFFF
ncbi:MAG: S-layer homology domain-containing protein, partial [Schwartzia sp.]|nr:S-layer homology domain-containing protein [Schwartzia sp. (in: firmicutes)]